MAKKTKRELPEQVRVRLNLRSSSAAQRHASKAAAQSRPGHGNRRQQKGRAIADSAA